MYKSLAVLMSLLTCIVLLVVVAPASATSIHATLQEYCAGTETCPSLTTSEGEVLTTWSGWVSTFGIGVRPDRGLFDINIVLLIPDDREEAALYGGIFNADMGLAVIPFRLFGLQPWSDAGQDLLTDYLGLLKDKAPAAHLASYMSMTRAVDGAANGYYVYRAGLGPTNFETDPDPMFTLIGVASLAPGSIIASYSTLAGSGTDGVVTGLAVPGKTILVDAAPMGVQAVPVPESNTAYLLWVGTALVVCCGWVRWRIAETQE